MLYINNQIIDKTTDINQIIKAIKALPSPFVNLEEDKVIEDKSYLKLLEDKINLIEKFFRDSGNSDACSFCEKLRDIFKEQEVSYFDCNGVVFGILSMFKFLLNSTKGELIEYFSHEYQDLWNIYLDKFQGKHDKDAYVVAQGEVGFSSNQKIGTYNLMSCIALIIRDLNSKKIALVHIDDYINEKAIVNVFKYMSTGDKKVVLIGAQIENDFSRKNLETIIKAILQYESNVYINNANIFCTYGDVTSCIVDPITFGIRYLAPKLEIDKEFTLRPPSRTSIMPYNPQGRLVFSFDLDLVKCYLPIEIDRQTAKNAFSVLKWINISCDNVFACNEDNIRDHLKSKEKEVINLAKKSDLYCYLDDESGLLKVTRLYSNALNKLTNKIKDFASLKVPSDTGKLFIEAITISLKTKKIFIGSGSDNFNQELLSFIEKYWSDFKNPCKKGEEPTRSQYLEISSFLWKFCDAFHDYELPFSTDFNDLDGCQKLREFMIRNKDAETSIPSTGLREVLLPEVPSFICYR